MAINRGFSRYVDDALLLLGQQIQEARLRRRWSQKGLAERAGITVPTLRRIERGDRGVGIGTVFTVAALVGVPLFHEDAGSLSLDLDRTTARRALLPQRARMPAGPVDDDF